MNHSEVHSHMADYLEGDLDLTQRALLDAHLDACLSCSREFAEMRGTIGLLRALPSPEPPPFLVERVMRRVREGEGRSSLADRLRDWVGALATPQVALPATAIALGLLMANGNIDPASIGWPGGGGQRSIRPVSQPQGLSNFSTGSPMANGPVNVGTPQMRTVQLPHLPPVGPPPVVAQAPHISISLPSPAGFGAPLVTGAATHRPLTRWAPRSVMSIGSDLANGGYAMPVGVQAGPMSGFDAGPSQGSSFSTVGEIATERDLARLDPRLASLIARPDVFSAEFARLSISEQEAWLRELAEQALELDRHEEVLRRLRSSADNRTLELATAFSAEMRRIAPGRSGVNAAPDDEGTAPRR